MSKEVADALNNVAEALYAIANAITPRHTSGEDATGGKVTSLTEAVMGITAVLSSSAADEALESVSDSLQNISDAFGTLNYGNHEFTALRISNVGD